MRKKHMKDLIIKKILKKEILVLFMDNITKKVI